MLPSLRGILTGVPLKETRQTFLKDLPLESVRSVLLRMLIVFLVGFLLSISLILIILLTLDYNPLKQKSFNYLFTIIVQDISFFLLVFILFYKRNLRQILSQLFPKTVNRAIVPVLLFLLINLIIGVSITIISFVFAGRNAEVWKWLSNYINSGPSNISVDYLYILFVSLLGWLIVGFFEEFIFRFTLYRFLRKRSFLLALFLSSLIFGLIHGSQGPVGAVIFGVTVALYYEFTNNFWGTVLLHALENVFIVYYSYYLTYYIFQFKLL